MLLRLFLLVVLSSTAAFATDQPISQMPSAAPISGSEQAYISQAGQDRALTFNQLPAFIFGQISGDCGISATGIASCKTLNGVPPGALYSVGVPLSLANGGTGTATPGLISGPNVCVSGAWPNQTLQVCNIIPPAALGTGAANSSTFLRGDNSWAIIPSGTVSTTLQSLTDVNVPNSAAIDSNQLMFDSVAAKWVAEQAFPGLVANNYYVFQPQQPCIAALGCTSVAVPAGTAVCSQGVALQTTTVDKLQINITTAGTSTVQLALYKNKLGNCPTNRPGAEIDATASMANTSTGLLSGNLSSGSVQIKPGIYWLCSNSNDSSMVATSVSPQSAQAWLIGSATGGALYSSTISGVSAAQTYGTWGDLSNAAWGTDMSANNPLVTLHLKSVP
jgi:hypothetical protein